MNDLLLRRFLRPRLCCDCCGAPIGEDESYYELPDGLTVCRDSDCLADWAAPYQRRSPPEMDGEVSET